MPSLKKNFFFKKKGVERSRTPPLLEGGVCVCVRTGEMRASNVLLWAGVVVATAEAQLTYKMVHDKHGRRMVASVHKARAPVPSPSPLPEPAHATLSDEQVQMLFNEAERRCDEAFAHAKREADERVEMATDVANALLKNMWTSMLLGTLSILGWTASLTLANLWLLRNLKKVTDALTFRTGEATRTRLMLRSQDGNDDLEEEDDSLTAARHRNARKERTSASGILAEAAAVATKAKTPSTCCKASALSSQSSQSQRRKGKPRANQTQNGSNSDDDGVLAE